MKLSDAMNTYNPALEKIVRMDYAITVIDMDERFDWEARKGDDIFIASDPLRLLGIICCRNEFTEKGIPNHYNIILTAYCVD